MAERSTAAVDVAEKTGEQKPGDARAGEATRDDGAAVQPSEETPGESEAEGASPVPAAAPQPPELHSGHRLADRYRLEECVTRLDGFSSWRAVDEKLRRAVGLHVLPSTHRRARAVLAAARAAALLRDPRFVQVLDAVEEDGLVYVVHEWLPDATPLSTLLLNGPLPAHEAYQLVSQLAQAMAAAHSEGLAHLRLTPGTVLRTGEGQFRIRGLAVAAALRGLTSDAPQRADTEAIGALLYAALTQRWPYEEDAHGLRGVTALTKGTLIPPDQVRAGVHRGLSELAMRALANDGATACRERPPCTTPDSLVKAVAELPRILPPTPEPPAANYRRTPAAAGRGRGGTGPAADAPPALPGRTGNLLKWGVSALLIAAVGLGSWQLADALMGGNAFGRDTTESSTTDPGGKPSESPTGKPVTIVDARDFDPFSSDQEENGDIVTSAFDGNADTFWHTDIYYSRPDLGGLKDGVGIVLDLGKPHRIGTVSVTFIGKTSCEVLTAAEDARGMPTDLADFTKVAAGKGEKVTLTPRQQVTSRYVLVWLTELPPSENGYRGRITDITITE